MAYRRTKSIQKIRADKELERISEQLEKKHEIKLDIPKYKLAHNKEDLPTASEQLSNYFMHKMK